MTLASMPLAGNEALLREALERILAVGSPQAVIVFGSRAGSWFRPYSDLDLLVIDRDNSEGQADTYREVMRSLPLDVDLLIRTPREVLAWRHVPNHLLSVIRREGRVLYEAPDQVADEPIEEKTYVDYARELMTLASDDTRAAELLIAAGESTWIICFHAQQAAEKYMKAVLALRGAEIPRTHNLPELQKILAAEHGVRVEADLEKISEFAVEPPYTLRVNPDPDTARRCVELAHRVREQLLSRLPG